MKHKIIELYSGIGGMHCAWNASGLQGEIVAAVDINTVANHVYKHNFPETNLICKNIQSLTPKQVQKFEANVILMSPPCQPFTRNGKYLDENDNRSNSFLYLIGILDQLHNIQYILMENVKGFECSTVRNSFINKLQECKFDYQEFLLCPTSVGVPNSRLRYYCIAKRINLSWNFKTKEEIIECLPHDYGTPGSLESIMEVNVPDTFLIPDKHLRRAKVFDICYRHSTRSCCFTKAYSNYIDGMGSVFTDADPETVKNCYKITNTFQAGSLESVEIMKPLKLRFFTPKEVLSIMSFPKTYSFPESTTNKQCYRLIGNSVNVKVISELIKLLFD